MMREIEARPGFLAAAATLSLPTATSGPSLEEQVIGQMPYLLEWFHSSSLGERLAQMLTDVSHALQPQIAYLNHHFFSVAQDEADYTVESTPLQLHNALGNVLSAQEVESLKMYRGLVEYHEEVAPLLSEQSRLDADLGEQERLLDQANQRLAEAQRGGFVGAKAMERRCEERILGIIGDIRKISVPLSEVEMQIGLKQAGAYERVYQAMHTADTLPNIPGSIRVTETYEPEVQPKPPKFKPQPKPPEDSALTASPSLEEAVVTESKKRGGWIGALVTVGLIGALLAGAYMLTRPSTPPPEPPTRAEKLDQKLSDIDVFTIGKRDLPKERSVFSHYSMIPSPQGELTPVGYDTDGNVILKARDALYRVTPKEPFFLLEGLPGKENHAFTITENSAGFKQLLYFPGNLKASLKLTDEALAAVQEIYPAHDITVQHKGNRKAATEGLAFNLHTAHIGFEQIVVTLNGHAVSGYQGLKRDFNVPLGEMLRSEYLAGLERLPHDVRSFDEHVANVKDGLQAELNALEKKALPYSKGDLVPLGRLRDVWLKTTYGDLQFKEIDRNTNPGGRLIFSKRGAPKNTHVGFDMMGGVYLMSVDGNSVFSFLNFPQGIALSVDKERTYKPNDEQVALADQHLHDTSFLVGGQVMYSENNVIPVKGDRIGFIGYARDLFHGISASVDVNLYKAPISEPIPLVSMSLNLNDLKRNNPPNPIDSPEGKRNNIRQRTQDALIPLPGN